MKAYAGRFPFDEPESDTSFWGIIDIVTLMLVFFIVLYVQEVQPGGGQPVEPSVKQQNTAAQVMTPPMDGEAEMSAAVQRHLDGLLGNGFYLSSSSQHVTLVLEERLSFSSGQATLAPEVRAILDQVSGLLQEENGYDVVISGHTDDLPIRNENYRSNWHLSAARAVAVAEALMARGVAPERLTTQGFAEFRPLHPNSDPTRRQQNRRVEITLVKKDGLVNS